MQVKITGAKTVIQKIETRTKRISDKKDFIFGKPLASIVGEIKQNLIKDTFNSGLTGRKHHVHSGTLFRQTKYKLVSQTTGIDFEASYQFGYFINYGKDLEIGSNPKSVPVRDLAGWIKNKFSNPTNVFARARALRNKIEESGSRAYPIIRPVWAKQKDQYWFKVKERVRAQWR